MLTHDGHISPTIIPTGHVGIESTEASMHKIFVSCDPLRGKDSEELPALFKGIFNDTYEDIILNNDIDFCPPEDFIASLVTSISATESQNEANITMEPSYISPIFIRIQPHLRYAVQLNCINTIRNITKKPSPTARRNSERRLDPTHRRGKS
jgi:hypothetical protein